MDKLFDAIAGNIIILGAFLVPIGIVGITSYFKHKRLELIHLERIAAIQKVIIPPGQLPDYYRVASAMRIKPVDDTPD